MSVTINKPNPYAKHLVSEPVKGTTTVTHVQTLGKGQKEEKLLTSTDELVSKGLIVAKEQLYMLEVGGGSTINLGNFESARIDVRLTAPCTKADLMDTYEWASDWVSERIIQAVKTAKG